MCIPPTHPSKIMDEHEIANILNAIDAERDAEREEEANLLHHAGDPSQFVYFDYESSDDDEDEEEEEEDTPPAIVEDDVVIARVVRNATCVLLSNIKATLRFMRIDVHNIEDIYGPTHRTAAMRIRLEDMESMIDNFEDVAIINPRRLTGEDEDMNLVPRRLFFDRNNHIF